MDYDNRLDYVSCSLNACPALSRQAGVVVDAFSNYYCLVSHYAFDHLPSCNHFAVVIACDAYHSFVAAVAGMNYSKDPDVAVVFDAHLLIY